MTKKKVVKPTNSLVSGELLKDVQACRPLRLFIKKQKKKGVESTPFALRAEFLQTSPEKQVKYFQKAIDKYIQLLDEKDIDEHVQIEGQLFENLLSKREQKMYFDSLDAPKKPLNTAFAYYAEFNKQEHNDNPKAWKSLTADEKEPYIKMLNDAKDGYTAQVQNFSENLPDRLKPEYLSFINQGRHTSQVNGENTPAEPISQRRKSSQPLPESFHAIDNDHQPKLNRSQRDDLHKCTPSTLYYETKVPDEEKPVFANITAKNVYVRSVYNQLSEKKRHKFILKSTAKWEEFLQLNPTIVENHIPTLHLLLSKTDDIHYYFSSLGLPSRPPVSALLLYSNEKQQTGLQKNWADLSQSTKDEYIKRLTKLKSEYHQKLIEFVEKTLPSDYIRFEFFRNIKNATKDYESVRKDRSHDKDRNHEKDEGQSKITQYLKPKKKTDSDDISEFDRIEQELLSTELTNQQKQLVQRLGQLMKKYIDETNTETIKSSSSKNSGNEVSKSISKHRASTNSNDVILVNGENSSDNVEHIAHEKKKKRKRDKGEDGSASTITISNEKEKQNSSSSSMKKRK
ncbi:unnamed protein product [Adineta steineri]|uniref:HMG box domain-containing protein n=1 Tax=Adineta steineri TaxID=433720 RepID=A0A818V7A3_9BILA|nr:unnamed protein product [Adineta steineri]